jgi:hypothetical protein
LRLSSIHIYFNFILVQLKPGNWLHISSDLLRRQLNSSEQNNSLPFKVKLQPFNPNFDDILTFLSEFDAVGNQAKWTDEIKISSWCYTSPRNTHAAVFHIGQLALCLVDHMMLKLVTRLVWLHRSIMFVVVIFLFHRSILLGSQA